MKHVHLTAGFIAVLFLIATMVDVWVGYMDWQERKKGLHG